MKEFTDRFFSQQDKNYRDFQAKLMPTVEKERVIGVRTPYLRAEAKEIAGTQEAESFMAELPHRYFEEDQLHAFLICEEKDFSSCVKKLDGFLPYVDNWATCDQMSPPALKRHRTELLPYIERWIAAEQTYTVRFGVRQLMDLFLDDEFDTRYADMAAGIRSDEYYVNMMIAWYFATALAKQYEAILPYIKEQRLSAWVHNRSIQKAIESRRLPEEHKEYLKQLKIKPGSQKR